MHLQNNLRQCKLTAANMVFNTDGLVLSDAKLLPAIVLLLTSAIWSAIWTPAWASDKEAVTESAKSFRESVAFITLRNKTGSDDAADFFGGDRDILRTGYCEIIRRPVPVLKTIADNVPFYVPDDVLRVDKIRQSSADGFWENINSSAGKSGQYNRPVLYTHGFNISFERGCKRASEFQRSLDLAEQFVVFSWPSAGLIVNYASDEADMYWSVAPLQSILIEAAESLGSAKLNIVAHSLGTRGVMLALVRLAESTRASQQRPIFDQLVFIAADIDAGIFRQYLPLIKPLVKNITIYVSEHDHPLAISNQLHGYPRLGEVGSHLQTLEGVEIIDISDVPVQYPSGHLYHLYNKHVIADLKQLLKGNLMAAKRKNLHNSSNKYWRLQVNDATSLEAMPLETADEH